MQPDPFLIYCDCQLRLACVHYTEEWDQWYREQVKVEVQGGGQGGVGRGGVKAEVQTVGRSETVRLTSHGGMRSGTGIHVMASQGWYDPLDGGQVESWSDRGYGAVEHSSGHD